MAASMEMEASSSEDEETLTKLKEAVVESSSIANFNSNPKEVGSKDNKEKKNQISLRPDKQTGAEEYRTVLETTPGMRKHIAKKLSAVLDSEIDTSDSCFCPVIGEVFPETTGVKLFHQSTRYIPTQEELDNNVNKPKRKRRLPSSSSDSNEDERLAEAAVSHDFVVKQSYQPYYTDHKPPDVTIVAGRRTSQQEVIPKIDCQPDKNVKECVVGEKSSRIDTEVNTDSVEFHKKKKKKKHKHTKSLEEG